MIKQEPLFFEPYLKSVIWGGSKIAAYKGIVSDEAQIGESWEISEVPGHESVVADGEYNGMNLSELIARYGVELLGAKVYRRYGGKFPLLVKIIDACDNLSVQVHPDDELAMKRHGSLGKTEMWYIIDSDPGSKIYAGLSKEITPEEYVKSVERNEFAELLAVHESEKGDVFFLPAGRVHAIGAGNLLAEIQESSDVTYRIYDYDRRDASGKGRELHTSQAKDAIDYKVYADYKSARPDDSVAECELSKCSHFDVRRFLVDGETLLTGDSDSFTVVMCISGVVEVVCADGSRQICQGTTVLVPACCREIKLSGHGTVITARVP